MRLRAEHFEAIVAHAERDFPDECCGIVGIDEDELSTVVTPLRNVARFPSWLYEVDPVELVEALLAIERAGDQLGFIYHSHPQSVPYPSGIDVARAEFPDAIYRIVGWEGGVWPRRRCPGRGRLRVRGYYIRGEEIEEVVHWEPLDTGLGKPFEAPGVVYSDSDGTIIAGTVEQLDAALDAEIAKLSSGRA